VKKINFVRDIDFGRIFLMILLILSLAFNYILKADHDWMANENALMKHQFIEDVVGYNYCDKD